MLLVVPHEGAHPVVTLDAESAQRVGQPGGLPAHLSVRRVSVAVPGRRGDHPIAVNRDGVPQDRGHRQREFLHGAVHGNYAIAARPRLCGDPLRYLA